MARRAARAGRVVAVCARPDRGVPKPPRPEITIGPDGVVGDYHAGSFDRHSRSKLPRPNRRQVSVVCLEVAQDLNARLGIALEPGDFGENVMVEGLGDLSDLAPGDRLRLGEAVLEVTAQNEPCTGIAARHPDIVRETVGRRGIVAVVARPGRVRPGDPVSVAGRASRPAAGR